MSVRPDEPVYRNPVLDADWSDPDVIRVGDDFYLTASSFGRVPGLPLLHSRDLVNWTLVGHALQRLEPESEFAVPRHDRGVWAPSLRHHDGRFWIFWGDPDRGIFQVNAAEIRGPWTRPHLVKAGRGLIDPCPLWDDETGEAYLVHAWAKSRSGVNNRLTGHRMHPHGTELLDEGKVIVDGDRIPGWFTLEGPSSTSTTAGSGSSPRRGVETGWQGAFRSRAFFGPYEEEVVLEQKDTDVNGPHQGGWVRTPSGEDWFLHFQQRGAYGRVVHLQPMRWGGGEAAGDRGRRRARHRAPPSGPAAAAARRARHRRRLPRRTPRPPVAVDRQPRDGWATHHSADGLRLTCVRTPDAHDLRALPNVLTQRLPGTPCTVEVDLRLDDGEPGARAGLAVLGDAYSWIGLERGPDGTVRLVHRFAETAAERNGTPRPRAPHPAAGPGCGSTSARARAAASRTTRMTRTARTTQKTPETAPGRAGSAPPVRSSPRLPGAGSVLCSAWSPWRPPVRDTPVPPRSRSSGSVSRRREPTDEDQHSWKKHGQRAPRQDVGGRRPGSGPRADRHRLRGRRQRLRRRRRGQRQGKIVFWDNNGGVRTDIWKEIIADFEDANPDIDVQYVGIASTEYQSKVDTAIQGGGLPDVGGISASMLAGFAAQGALEPLDERLEGSSLNGKLNKDMIESLRAAAAGRPAVLRADLRQQRRPVLPHRHVQEGGPSGADHLGPLLRGRGEAHRQGQQPLRLHHPRRRSIAQALDAMYGQSGITSFWDSTGKKTTVNDPKNVKALEKYAALFKKVTPPPTSTTTSPRWSPSGTPARSGC